MNDDKKKMRLGDYTIKPMDTPGSKIDDFLKKKNPNVDKLRQGKAEKLEKGQVLEEFIQNQKEKRERVTLTTKVKKFIEGKFRITFKKNSILIWKNRKVEELLFLQIPRFLFLIYTCYICWKIKLRHEEVRDHKKFVKSERQESIEKQLQQINQVLGNENTFDPNNKTVFNSELSSQKIKYLHEIEEKKMQDDLFKMYEVLQDDYDKSTDKSSNDDEDDDEDK